MSALPATGSSPPDWAAINEEILCPLCSYNLRGLTEARCPECGYAFDWPDLIDPARRKHPYLFEHHPQRNVWSFFRTLAGSLRPRRFWRKLRPEQPGDPRRLILYWLLAQATVLLAFVGVCAIAAMNVHRNSQQMRAWWTGAAMARQMQNWSAAQVQATQQMLDRDAALPPSRRYFELVWRQVGGQLLRPDERTIWFFVFTAWPWFTLGALSIFQISMRRARVRSIHVLRCALYSSDVVAWYYPFIAAGFASAFALSLWIIPATRRVPVFAEWIGIAMIAMTVLIGIALPYRLWMAYRFYLRFHRPFWTVLSSQVIVILMMLLMALWMGAIP